MSRSFRTQFKPIHQAWSNTMTTKINTMAGSGQQGSEKPLKITPPRAAQTAIENLHSNWRLSCRLAALKLASFMSVSLSSSISSDTISLLSAQQLRQLGDVGRDPPRLVAGQQLGRRTSARLLLESAWPLLSLTMKQAALASSMSHGGGKWRGDGMKRL